MASLGTWITIIAVSTRGPATITDRMTTSHQRAIYISDNFKSYHQVPITVANEKDALAYVRSHLGLSDARTEAWANQSFPTPPDLLLQDEGKVYVVEVKAGRANIHAVGQLCLYRDMIARNEGLSEDRIELVLAAKSIPEGVRQALANVDGQAVPLPPGLELQQAKANVPLGKTQVTTPKAWRVACTLLAQPLPSINQLHEEADVSYGWTHRTVRNLEEHGILTRENGLLTITEPSKLLNGVAWERPLNSLKTRELQTNFGSVEEGGRELTRTLDRAGTSFAFTAYTAASLYTGYAFRNDTFYLYTDDPDLIKEYVQDGDGPTLVLYEPDRTLEDTQLVEDIRVASRCQVLLDLAGMGPKAGDITRAMVENLA